MMRRTLLQLPSQCEVCRRWPAQALCEACVALFAQPLPRCRLCALTNPGQALVCGRCLHSPPPWQACLAAVDYGYPWSGVIAQFKFRDHAGWAPALARLMRSAPWVEPALERADVVLPIPLSSDRLRTRGYNQSLQLAKHLAARKVQAHTLLRLRHTAKQSELPLAQRWRNVDGAFAVDPLQADQLRGRHVVLVDDVMTTGASLSAAASPLLQAGVAHLTCLVLARTPPGAKP